MNVGYGIALFSCCWRIASTEAGGAGAAAGFSDVAVFSAGFGLASAAGFAAGSAVAARGFGSSA